jgi:photosystem II stability/assembly factor-like uncharacterized protein
MQSGEPKIVQFPTDRARERTAGALAAAQAEPLPPPGDRWELVSPAGGWGGTVLALSTPVPLLERPEEDETQPLFAGTTSGCFISLDNGQTWEPQNEGLSSPYVQAITVSPRYDRDPTVFAGSLGGGVMRSSDGGHTWSRMEFWQAAAPVTAIALSSRFPSDGTILAATQYEGIQRSTNAGHTWSTANFGLGDLSIMALEVSPTFDEDEMVFCAATDGLYRSTNGARAWRRVRGLPTEAVQAIAFSPSFPEDSTIFVGTEDAGIFRSTNRGMRWQPVNDGLTDTQGDELPPVNALWVSPHFGNDATIFAGTAGSGVFRSTDGGKTWQQHGAEGEAVMALLGQPDGTMLAGCHQNGIMRIAADGTTTPANQGIAARSMSALALSPDFERDGVLYTAGIEDGVLRSADRGATWQPVGALPTNQVLSLAVAPRPLPEHVLLAATDDGLYRSTDSGAQWERATFPETEDEEVTIAGLDSSAVRMVTCAGGTSHEESVCAAVVGQRLMLSMDSGATWSAIEPPTNEEMLIGVALSPQYRRDQTVLVGTYSQLGAARLGRVRAPGARAAWRQDLQASTVTIWRSLDGGEKWTPIIEQLSGARWAAFGLPDDYRGDQEDERNRFFVGLGTLVLRPMFGGKALWIAERVGRPSSGVLSVALTSGGVWGRALFIGSSEGVYRSDDEGLTWQSVNTGLGSRTVVSVALSPGFNTDGRAYALTLGGTLWRLAAGS